MSHEHILFLTLFYRVILDGMGKIQIRKPTKKDQGTYGCAVANHLGSDVESSSVLYAGNARYAA